MPDPNYFSKLRQFLTGTHQRSRTTNRRTRRRRSSSRSEMAFTLESLEPRVLLAADLAGAVQAAQVIDPLVAQGAPIVVSHEVSQTGTSSQTILGQFDNVPSERRTINLRFEDVDQESITVTQLPDSPDQDQQLTPVVSQGPRRQPVRVVVSEESITV